MRIILRILTIVFVFMSFGGVLETHRIFFSDAPDIVRNRSGLIPMSIIMTLIFLSLTIWFWILSIKARRKHRKKKESKRELESIIDGQL